MLHGANLQEHVEYIWVHSFFVFVFKVSAAQTHEDA